MFWQEIPNTEKAFIDSAEEVGCLKIGSYGDFELKNGRPSPYFFDTGEFSNGEHLHVVGNAYARKIMDKMEAYNFDFLFGPAEKGVPLAVATSMQLEKMSGYGKPVFWDRKIPKTHGEHNRETWLVGPYDHLVRRVKHKSGFGKLGYIMTEDVVTDGATKKEAMNLIQREIKQIAEENNVESYDNPECRLIVISLNRREQDGNGRNPITVFEQTTNTPFSWVTDSYNAIGHLLEGDRVTKSQIKDFVRYQEEFGLPEDRARLEELGLAA